MGWIILLTVLLGMWLFLIAPGRSSRAARAPFEGRAFAHRGLYKLDQSIPENSLPAFQRAVENGYGAELDVQRTKDGRIVVFHDDSMRRACGVDRPVRDFTYEELAAAGHRATVKLQSSSGFCPTVDGKYVTDPSFDPAAPEISRNIPMLLGSNKNEFTYDNSPVLTQDEVLGRIEKQMGKEKAAAFVKAFDAAYPGHTPQEMVYTDLFLRKAAVNMADVKSAQKAADVYMYFFTWKPSGNNLGACHGMELPFVFNNIALQREMTGGTADAYRLSDLMSSAWISFIRTGDPNVSGLPAWEPYTAENGNTMVFDKDCKVVHNHDRELMKFDLPRRF